jgi:hypothetical protein
MGHETTLAMSRTVQPAYTPIRSTSSTPTSSGASTPVHPFPPSPERAAALHDLSRALDGAATLGGQTPGDEELDQVNDLEEDEEADEAEFVEGEDRYAISVCPDLG